jgi:hypothetical protein
LAAERPDHLQAESRTKWSAAELAAERPGHLLSEGRTRPKNGQEQDLQQKDETTYSLRAEKGHKMVKSRISSRKTRPHTF